MTERTYYSREAEMRANQERVIGTIPLLALALGIGVVLALLFAPNDGEKTRRELGDAVEETLDSGREATNTALKRLEHDFADLRKKVEDRIHEMR